MRTGTFSRPRTRRSGRRAPFPLKIGYDMVEVCITNYEQAAMVVKALVMIYLGFLVWQTAFLLVFGKGKRRPGRRRTLL